MDKYLLSERDICTKFITPFIQRAGWSPHQFREEVKITDGRVVVRGRLAARIKNPDAKGGPRRADYVLYARPNIPLAVVEAKQAKFSVGHGMQQALAYAEMLDAPFAVSSNGDGFLLHDRTGITTPVEREIAPDEFPSPEELWAVYQRWRGLTEPAKLQLVEQPYFSDGGGRETRYYQRVAINRTVEAVAKGRPRILLVMATGTGKTFTAFQIIWRLWKVKAKRRILFLADRNFLVDQTMQQDFAPFGEVMHKITNREVKKNYEIYLSLYQAVTGKEEWKQIYRQFPPDFFDLIVVDECHRGSAADDSAWREVLDYEIRGHVVEIKASIGKRPSVLIDGERASAKRLSDEARSFLPSTVFVYYSGKNERIEQLFQAHQKRFNQRMEITAEEYLPEHLLNDLAGEEQAEAVAEHTRRADRQRERLGEDQLRRIFYCRGGHSQLVLLACLLSGDEAFTRLLNDLNIVELDSALFVLKQPYRLRQNRGEKDLLEGDNRFWYARGEVISEFLDKLWQLAVAPIEHTASKLVDFRGRTEKQEQLYLFIPDQEKLRELGALVGEADRFFRYAEAAYIGDLIDEVRIRVRHKDAAGNISFDQLSEGEPQLLTVLGLMRITSQDHCLFLLDEPDTHLNPIWKLRYFDEITKISRQNAAQTVAGSSQVIITTHDPMMIGSLRREQVRILRKANGKSVVEEPDQHPQGMGVTGLLRSELFGLRATVDSETLRRLDRRNFLFAQGERRTAAEDVEMKRLSEELSDLGFATSDFSDPYYAMFIRKMALHTKFHKETLTTQEQEEQDAIADEIVEEILRAERMAG